MRGTVKQTKVAPPQVEIVAEYAFDLDRTLRGFMVLCGVSNAEIEDRLRKRQTQHGIVEADEQSN